MKAARSTSTPTVQDAAERLHVVIEALRTEGLSAADLHAAIAVAVHFETAAKAHRAIASVQQAVEDAKTLLRRRR